jgi:glycosyltransferase involved in cell wall biosynthesis
MKYKKLSFVIPVYNEERTLEQLLAKVEAAELDIEKEIVLVDDGSRDRSPEILRKLSTKPGYKVLFNESNSGKSQTVKHGLLATTGDLVVIQDADLEYDPEDLDEFVQTFQLTNVDIIYGNRFGKDNKVVYWQNWIGNTALSYFSALITGLRAGMWTRDMEVCYKMVKGEVYREIAAELISRSRFGLEPELTALFSKYKLDGRHLRFRQIPICYYPRTLAEGKHMNAVKDGLKAGWEIIKFNFFKH